MSKVFVVVSSLFVAFVLNANAAHAGDTISDAFEDTFGHNKIPNAFNEAFGGSSGSSHHKAKKAQPQNAQPAQ